MNHALRLRLSVLPVVLIGLLLGGVNGYAQENPVYVIEKMNQFRGQSHHLDWKKEIEYNEYCQPIRETKFSPNGWIQTVNTFSYLPEGGPIRKQQRYSGEGNFLWELVYSYDESNSFLIYEQKYLSDERLHSAISYNYNEENLLIHESHYNGTREEVKRIQYEYDAQGTIVTQTIYRLRNNELQKDSYTTYTYSEDGLQDGKIVYDGNGSVRAIFTFEYDPITELCILKKQLDEAGIMHQETISTYDEHENLTSKIIKKNDGGEYLRLHYEYDYRLCD